MTNQPFVSHQAASLQKKVSIRMIGPAEAKALLAKNAINQRPLRTADVSRYTIDMIKGNWIDDVSAITVDAQGNLINGQHRLYSVIESGTVQSFIFAENWPSASMRMMDQGNKRSQLDRINVGGVTMPRGADSVVRHSLTPWSANQGGGAIFNRRSGDDRVTKTYLKHREFIDLIIDKYKSSGVCSPLVMGATLYGYAQACLSSSKGRLSCDPWSRIALFLDILSEGPVMTAYNPATDAQAMLLREWLLAIKNQNRRPIDGQCFRVVVSCLARFLKETHIKNVSRVSEKCPWGPMESLPGTDK